MRRAVVFETSGLIDIRAFTTFGVNAKPNTSSPIGYFGTGLKYAIAVLVRGGCKPILYIGKDRYTFYKKTVNFRGRKVEQVGMRTDKHLFRRRSYHELPFTTNLGRNWEMWQAFRELEANTRDEQGQTYLCPDLSSLVLDPTAVAADHTLIIIESEEFSECYLDKDRTFLPESLTQRITTDNIQILNQPSRHLYYRGMRVKDLDKPTLHTYNILESVDLTEDRTLKYDFQAHIVLARYLASKCDNEDLIREVVKVDDQHWEHGIDWEYVSDIPSDMFRQVIKSNRDSGEYLAPSALRLYRSYVTDELTSIGTLFDVHPLPWRCLGLDIYDLNSKLVTTTSIRGYNSAEGLKQLIKHINSTTTATSQQDAIPF